MYSNKEFVLNGLITYPSSISATVREYYLNTQSFSSLISFPSYILSIYKNLSSNHTNWTSWLFSLMYSQDLWTEFLNQSTSKFFTFFFSPTSFPVPWQLCDRVSCLPAENSAFVSKMGAENRTLLVRLLWGWMEIMKVWSKEVSCSGFHCGEHSSASWRMDLWGQKSQVDGENERWVVLWPPRRPWSLTRMTMQVSSLGWLSFTFWPFPKNPPFCLSGLHIT